MDDPARGDTVSVEEVEFAPLPRSARYVTDGVLASRVVLQRSSWSSAPSRSVNLMPVVLVALLLTPGCAVGGGGDGRPDPVSDAGTPRQDSGTVGRDAGDLPATDAGPEPENDAGSVLPTDAGSDAGAPPRLDAGEEPSIDAGFDAGMEGTVDAGVDAGMEGTVDAGPPPSDSVLLEPGTSTTVSGDTTSGPTWRRPLASVRCPASSFSSVATAVTYELVRVTNISSTTLTVTVSSSASYDGYLVVYSGSEIPSDPLLCVEGDDDSGGGSNPSLTFSLPAGETATIVQTGFDNDDVGPYAMSISAS